jgi:hypothetical protein
MIGASDFWMMQEHIIDMEMYWNVAIGKRMSTFDSREIKVSGYNTCMIWITYVTRWDGMRFRTTLDDTQRTIAGCYTGYCTHTEQKLEEQDFHEVYNDRLGGMLIYRKQFFGCSQDLY